jgi:alkaline phosphatase
MHTHGRIHLLIFTVLAAGTLAQAAWNPLPPRVSVTPAGGPPPGVRNVIVLIPDGCSQSMVTLARWYRGAPLAVDQLQSGAVKTHSANSLVTDSAAAATALACGVKTSNRMIGVAPPANAPFRPADLPYAADQPLASVLEGAKRSGRAVGVVVTVPIWDATPAAFTAHTTSRYADPVILEQMLHQNLDVVLGGGRAALLPKEAGGSRTDGRDLQALLQARGVTVVSNATALARLARGQVWGLFAPGALTPEIDRPRLAPEQPSLAQMTEKAIQLLQQNKNGFFLLVEGSQVDKADHANEAARAVREFLAFDEAVAVALHFAANAGQGQTLIIACPDHDTGGLTIGQRGGTPQTVADLTGPLARTQSSVAALSAAIGTNQTMETILPQLEAWWGVHLSPAEASDLTNRLAKSGSLETTLLQTALHAQPNLGWATGDHTGVDVPLWSYGPGRPVGLLNNTDIARHVANALQLNLAALTRQLFVDAQAVFPDATYDKTDPANPVLRIGSASLPVNQNRLMLANQKEHRLDGVVVHIETTGRTYLPQSAVDLLRAKNSEPKGTGEAASGLQRPLLHP